jgi:membrane fusion protein (multidrug efflux system)
VDRSQAFADDPSVGLPAPVLVIGLGIYLSGGRYISTDNAYVGAQKS